MRKVSLQSKFSDNGAQQGLWPWAAARSALPFFDKCGRQVKDTAPVNFEGVGLPPAALWGGALRRRSGVRLGWVTLT